MKKYLILLLCAASAACTTTQELKQAQTCNVWKDQAVIGPRSYRVNNDAVEVKGECMFWFWGCSVRKTDIDAEGGIYHEGEGIFSSRKKIASLQGSEVVYEKSIFDALATADPVKIDMDKKTAHRKVNVQIFKMSGEDTVEFNNSCKLKEAAVGAVAYWVNENKSK